ncbi:MAG: hypothetical protein LBP23_00630 [Treponema sp.]|nr:hypothetical protein [Treponema sp.]
MKTMTNEDLVKIAGEINRKYPGFLQASAEHLAAAVSLKTPPSRRQKEIGFLSALSGEWRLRNLDPALAGSADLTKEGDIFRG